MQPEEYKHLKSFKDLIEDTMTKLEGASSQAVLASTVDELLPRWYGVHDEFAEVLAGIKAQVWKMPFPQVSQVAKALVSHLQLTLDSVKQQLRAG